LALSSRNQNVTNVLQNTPKGRCPDFPYCTNKECPKAHPTKTCIFYPKCPNPPGTCNFVHPDQDVELLKKLEISRKEHAAKWQMQQMVQQGTCKYRLECGKDSCPFAHPTPANKDAKVTTLDWCAEGKSCTNVNCSKSHPPPATATFKQTPSALDIALEQCKFAANCKKPKCPRRHATSTSPCREGSACRRLDCTFSHPLTEDCRFGAACLNKFCLYQHPKGRTVQSNTWVKDDSNSLGGAGNSVVSTSNRAFAVADDQTQPFQV